MGIYYANSPKTELFPSVLQVSASKSAADKISTDYETLQVTNIQVSRNNSKLNLACLMIGYFIVA